MLGEALARLQEAIEGWRREYPGVKWEQADDLHITLQFLGKVGPERLPGLVAALGEIRAPRFNVNLTGLRRKGVLWAEVERNADLERLAEEVMRRSGVPREPRPYRPHVTLARPKENVETPREGGTWGKCPVEGFHLYETSSVIAAVSRPRYRVVHRFD